MLRRLTPYEQISVLTETWEPELRRSFLDAVAEVVSRITLSLVIERLERNDIQGAIDALNIEEAVFAPIAARVHEAFNAGGAAIVGSMPQIRGPDGHRAVLRFDVRDLIAEAWARQHGSTLILGLTEAAKESARVTVEAGMAQGQGPRAIALDLAGRINRATGRREGGTVGLTAQQAQQMLTVREILSDPDRIHEFFVKDRETGEMKPRYKTTSRRWDRQIAKAIREGKALSSADVAKISAVQANNLLKLRAETIARTETMEAIETSQHEGYRQTMARLGLNPLTDVEKEWQATSGTRTRDTHAAMHGQKVEGLDSAFRSISGALLRYPGDRSMGAPASELINCRCHPVYRLRFERALR